LTDFISKPFNNILVSNKDGDSLIFVLGLPTLTNFKVKQAVCFKTDSKDESLEDDDVQNRVSFLELNKNALENL